nr:hypothetical protein [uncultured Flavobacterium sp.]
MYQYKSIFISISGMDPGWIIGKISNDLKATFNNLGIECEVGSPAEYNNQEVCYHMGWAYATPQKNAKINPIFITHIDDKLKENLLVSLKDKFDYFISMSIEDEQFLIDLGFPAEKCFGLTLPIRNTYIRPLSIGIFSSVYLDGRKNEQWLLDFCNENETAKLFNFVFIGPEWGKFVDKLAKLQCSFEWHSTARVMPFEYEFQQQKLQKLDYYFYPGFDGGAMGSYDAYFYGVKLIIADDGYHKSIPNIDYPFSNHEEFIGVLSELGRKQKEKIDFFKVNNPNNYGNTLLKIWSNNYQAIPLPVNAPNSVLEKKRKFYSKISTRRLLSNLKSLVYKLINK